MNNTDQLLIGFKFKGLRLANDLTPSEVAAELDISKTYLSLIENGKKVPSQKVINKAALLFNISVESFQTSSSAIDDLTKLADEASLADVITAFELILSKKSK
ncbi:helix-turn-helix domain-containing protein [Pseudoalteromonas sp. CNC9-20]|uniref:helix-turn-helix domain-containing protein n=1 Tax=Pseudoalteromonas sp. CNC9-20 TaxID=2917750 RepID=UPI001EF6541C|nr:helix-turn-helix transcriptional regulator [Pseudoalteromonas sp. CNC9-20]MCG7569828.1 helix-turn-helix domain-containing protein [Pseudoalteromonas sp. CNC9-20]